MSDEKGTFTKLLSSESKREPDVFYYSIHVQDKDGGRISNQTSEINKYN